MPDLILVVIALIAIIFLIILLVKCGPALLVIGLGLTLIGLIAHYCFGIDVMSYLEPIGAFFGNVFETLKNIG